MSGKKEGGKKKGGGRKPHQSSIIPGDHLHPEREKEKRGGKGKKTGKGRKEGFFHQEGVVEATDAVRKRKRKGGKKEKEGGGGGKVDGALVITSHDGKDSVLRGRGGKGNGKPKCLQIILMKMPFDNKKREGDAGNLGEYRESNLAPWLKRGRVKKEKRGGKNPCTARGGKGKGEGERERSYTLWHLGVERGKEKKGGFLGEGNWGCRWCCPVVRRSTRTEEGGEGGCGSGYQLCTFGR